MARNMLFKRKTSLVVNMRAMESERESLADFLRSHFRLHSSLGSDGLELSSEDVSPSELTRMVTKFVYHKNLNSTYYVTSENNVVKINRFKPQKKVHKNKNPVTASTIRHGW